MEHDWDLLILGGLVVTGQSISHRDVGVRSGRFEAIAAQIEPQRAVRVVDAHGKYVLPGVIDVHTHPVYLDDLGGTSIAAAHGGVTTLVHNAYAKPNASLMATLRQYRADGEANSVLDFVLHGGLFDVEDQLAEVPQAFGFGVTSFKVFMTYAKLKWMTDGFG